MAQQRSPTSIVAHFIAPLGGLLLGIMLTALHTYFILYASVNQTYRSTLANQKATQVANFFDQRQNQIQNILKKNANADTVTQLFLDSDKDGLREMEHLLVELIPHAIEVKLIPAGKARIERDTELPFTFTSKDMVNRAESNSRVFAEAFEAGEEWIITMAQQVYAPNGSDVVGTLFIYLDRNAYAEDLENVLDDGGEVTLLQQFGVLESKPFLVLGDHGNNDYPPIAKSLLSPHWEVWFVPSPAIAAADFGSALDFVLPLILFFLIALLGLVIGFILLNRHLNRDATLLRERIGDAFRGRHPSEVNYFLNLFHEVDGVMDRLVPQARPDNATTVVIPVKQAAAVKSNIKSKPRPEAAEIVEMEEEDQFDTDLTFDEEIYEEAFAAIFRAYDIRGIVDDTLTSDTIHRIGLAIGSEALSLGEQTIVVGADGRVSSPDVAQSLIQGLRDAGVDVIDIGAVPTPILYFATQHLDTQSGVMVTASHNPGEYNGFKVVLAGHTLGETEIQGLYERIREGDFTEGEGTLIEEELVEQYIATICDDIVIAQPLKIVVDCGNGIAGPVAPALFTELGCEVVELYCDVDGTFPNHQPDPSVPENLSELVASVTAERADLGIGFDGDGDRFVVVTGSGDIIWPDRLMMLFAKDVVSRNPGTDVVYDVQCTRHLNSVISSFGGRPIICRSGHSFMKAKMAETGALLGGEMNGHFYFNERWNGFDDGLYAAARLLELVGATAETLKQLMAEFPHSLATPEIRLPMGDEDKFEVLETLRENAEFGEGNVTQVDGLRVDYSDGWGLVRVSNTTPNITLRFEADSVKALERIKGVFKEQLSAARSDLKLDF